MNDYVKPVPRLGENERYVGAVRLDPETRRSGDPWHGYDVIQDRESGAFSYQFWYPIGGARFVASKRYAGTMDLRSTMAAAGRTYLAGQIEVATEGEVAA